MHKYSKYFFLLQGNMYNDLLLLQRRKSKQVKKILFDTYCPMHTNIKHDFDPIIKS
jgi:hypothetical protein